MSDLNANSDPYAAAAWLVSRHPTPRGLVDRLAAWTAGQPDVEAIAQAVNEYDEDTRLWKAYADAHPAPNDDTRYDAWEAAGPPSPAAARVIGPMSSGEKRMVRMLAVLAPATRVRFRLDDSTGVDRPFRDDWARLIAGAR